MLQTLSILPNQLFEKEFYNLCKLDNLYIFTFKGTDAVKLPAMTMADLDDIIEGMKSGKACDYYQMTAEHLKYCGEESRIVILNLVYNILS